MAIIKCPECGRQISDKAPTCPSCGVEIAGKITKCPHCGEVYFSSQEICPNCHEIAVGVAHPVASSAAVKDPTPVASPSPVSSPASEIPSTSQVVSSTSQTVPPTPPVPPVPPVRRPGVTASGNDGGEYRIDSCKHTDADASERGMSDAAADEYQSAGNDVGSDKAAQDACQKGAYQCVLEKCIL